MHWYEEFGLNQIDVVCKLITCIISILNFIHNIWKDKKEK